MSEVCKLFLITQMMHCCGLDRWGPCLWSTEKGSRREVRDATAEPLSCVWRIDLSHDEHECCEHCVGEFVTRRGQGPVIVLTIMVERRHR